LEVFIQGIACEEDDSARKGRVESLESFEESAAIETRHAEVRDDGIESLAIEQIKGAFGGFATGRPVAEHADHFAQEFADGSVVVEDQDTRGFHE
jgi:hypothetical protein